MRRMVFGVVLAILVLGGGLGESVVADERERALGKEAAKELLARAAAASPRYLNTLVALGEKLALEDLLDPKADVPLTAAVVVLGGKSRVDERDYRLLRHATPKTFSEAVSPLTVRAGQRVPKYHYASILHTEYVTDISVEVSGRTATGAVGFRAPDVYEGRLRYSAYRAATGWRVLEFSFPKSGIRVALENGRWQLHLPDESESGADTSGRTDLDLPRVGTVGVLPPQETRVVVRVTREGWIRVPGSSEPLGLRDLHSYLRHKTRGPALREPDGSSKVDALLDVDETIPWCVTQWLMQTCAHPDLKIYKIWFGARARKDGIAGAVSTELPKDRGLAPTPTFPEDFYKIKVKVFKLEGRGPTSGMRPLHEQLKALAAAVPHGADLKYEIVAPPPKGGAVPHGYVMQLIDVCLAVGARDIIFEGAARPLGPDADSAEAIKQLIDRLRKTPGVPVVKVNNMRPFVGPEDTGLPAVPAKGALKLRWGTGVTQLRAETVEQELQETKEERGEVRDPPKKEGSGDPVAPQERPEAPPDEPYEAPGTGGSIGIGGGAGGAFRGRGGQRNLNAVQGALRTRAEGAVNHALGWLAAHQSPDGGWSASGFGDWCNGKPVKDPAKIADGQGKALYDVGITGLALNAFLSAGYTNRGRHPYAKVVSRGLRFLKNVQDPEGCFGPRTTQQYIYNHAMAALAMVEAYGMTGSPIFKGAAQRSLDFVALARNPYFAWRYGVKPGDNDTSVSSWMVLVLHSALRINEDAINAGRPAPLTVDDRAFDGFKAWIDKVTDAKTGRVGYVTRGTGPARPQNLVDRFPGKMSESMTAAGIFGRILIGEDPRTSKPITLGLDLLRKLPPVWNPSSGQIDMYYWHWGSLACWQAGGRAWRTWEETLVEALAGHQRMDTDPCRYEGSWDPIDPWGLDGGRVYATALNALSLQAYRRYDRKFNVR